MGDLLLKVLFGMGFGSETMVAFCCNFGSNV